MTRSQGIRAQRGSRQQWADEQQGRHVCACGCGETIEVRPYHANKGIPRYRPHHLQQVAPLRGPARSPSVPCKCGCGEMTARGRAYRRGHNQRGGNNHRTGIRPANFIGRQRTVEGYIVIAGVDHPFRSENGVREHRLVMENHLRVADPASPYLVEVDGRLYLSPRAEVHHENGVKDHNVLSNLRVLWKDEHARLHMLGRKH